MARMLKIVASLFLLIVISIATIIGTFDINQYKNLLINVVQDSTGRTLHIDGDLSFGLSLVPTIVIEGAKLSNASWGSSPEMISLDRLEIKLALLSLLDNKIQINRVTLVEAEIFLETDNQGLPNWEFITKNVEKKASSSKPEQNGLGLAIDKVVIENAVVIYKNWLTEHQTKTVVEELEIEADSFDTPVFLFIDAVHNDIPLEVEGILGSINQLRSNQKMSLELEIEVAGSELELAGQLSHPMDGEGLDLNFKFDVKKLSDLSVLAGRDLPALGPVSMSGKIMDRGGIYSVKSLDMQANVFGVKGAKFNLTGQIADVQKDKGIDLTLKFDIKNLADLSALAGKALPALGPLSFSGKIVDDENYTYALKKIDLQTGVVGVDDAKVLLSGEVADLVTAKGINVTAKLEVDKLSDLSHIAGKELPALGPIILSGNIIDFKDGYSVNALDVKTGVLGVSGANIALNGKISDLMAAKGLDINFNLDVKKLTTLSPLLEKDLPALSQVKLSGNITDQNETYAIKAMKLQAGLVDVKNAKIGVTGQVTDLLNVKGVDVLLSLDVEKLTELSKFIDPDLPDLPDLGPFKLTGNVTDSKDSYALKAMEIQAGVIGVSDAKIALTGQVADLVNVKGLDVGFKLDVERLTDLAAMAGRDLPAIGPVEVSGKISGNSDAFSVQSVTLKTGVTDVPSAKIELTGKVAKLLEGKGIDVGFKLDIDNLADLSTLAGQELPKLGPLKLSGNLTDFNDSYSIKEMDLRSGVIDVPSAKIELTGKVARLLEGKGIDVGFKLNIDNLADLSTLAGQELPNLGPVKLSGNLTDFNDSYSIKEMDLHAGVIGISDAKIALTGQIEDLVNTKGLDLGFNIDVTKLADLSTLTDSELPEFGPVKMSGKLTELNDGYSVKALSLKSQNTDLSGDVNVVLSGKRPMITADLSSTMIDLPELFSDTESVEKETNKTRVFSADPLPTEDLKLVDLNVKIDAQQLKTKTMTLANTNMDIKLNDGYLIIEPLMSSVYGANVTGHFELNTNEKINQVAANISFKGLEPSQLPDLELKVSNAKTDVIIIAEGSGNSVSQIMAGLDGKFLIQIGEGTITDPIARSLNANVLTATLSLLNPFSGTSRGAEQIDLKCAVVNFDIKNGIATTNQGIAISTRNLNIIGTGAINLESEQLDIGIKPHVKEGVSLGLGQLVSLVRISGTLAKPTTTADPTAIVSTGWWAGQAIATGGLSLLAQGLFGRVTADIDPCATALAQKTVTTEDKSKSSTNSRHSRGFSN
jgi:AsmA family protein